MAMNTTRIAEAKRLVIKVGSALVTNNGEGLDTAAIREWARGEGMKVSDRGRVPGSVIAAYEAAH